MTFALRTFLAVVFAAAALPSSCQDSPSEPHSDIHVVILGDSNTWIGGDDSDKPCGWNKWFADIFKPATCKSYARSGATWSNTSTTRRNTKEDIGVIGPNNVIYNQVERLAESCNSGMQPTPDVIIIAAGTNDAWFVKKRPGVFSKTAAQACRMKGTITSLPPNRITSLAEAVVYNTELLRQRFPNARIILLTPLQSVHPTEANFARATTIIEECGTLLGLPVVRQDKECCVRRADEARQHRFTSDGTHTSEEGAKQIGTYLASRIASILNSTSETDTQNTTTSNP